MGIAGRGSELGRLPVHEGNAVMCVVNSRERHVPPSTLASCAHRTSRPSEPSPPASAIGDISDADGTQSSRVAWFRSAAAYWRGGEVQVMPAVAYERLPRPTIDEARGAMVSVGV